MDFERDVSSSYEVVGYLYKIELIDWFTSFINLYNLIWNRHYYYHILKILPNVFRWKLFPTTIPELVVLYMYLCVYLLPPFLQASSELVFLPNLGLLRLTSCTSTVLILLLVASAGLWIHDTAINQTTTFRLIYMFIITGKCWRTGTSC